jgi:hypothetical protein
MNAEEGDENAQVVVISEESPKKKKKVQPEPEPAVVEVFDEGEEVEEEGEEVWRVVQIGQVEKPPSKKSSKKKTTAGGFQYTESVRGKERENLKETTDCAMCSAYYDALSKETGQTKSALIKQCTRHRSRFQQVETPPGYWDVGWK